MKSRQYRCKKFVQYHCYKTFGFAPFLKEIDLLESSECSEYVVSVAFSVSGIGYVATIGEPVVRDWAYDCLKGD